MKMPTQKQRLQIARELIDTARARHGLDAPWDEEGVSALLACFDPRVRDDWSRVAGAQCRRNAEIPTDPRHVWFLIGGAWQPRSWVKWVTGHAAAACDGGARSRLLRACREAARSQVERARVGLEMDAQGCARCGSARLLQVDHAGMPFDDIVEYWIVQRDWVMPVLDHGGGRGDVLRPSDEASFRATHGELARYQLLCRSCNASKGNRR